MPGTIHVSVIGFLGLPSSSISVKVSMGKREYQTLKNGDVSFPLVSLRENVIITLYDSEGNQISQSGIQTILVVEKGLWVDYFPLEGGGHVHLKLQFILSEVDRNRIRMMRESALKKKQSELLNNSLQSSETTSSITNAAASSFSKNREVSATSSGEAATQVSVVLNPVSLFMDPESANGILEEIHVATQASMVSDPINLCTAPQSNTGIEDDTQVAPQVSSVSDPVSLYTDPQSSTETKEESWVATQVSSVSNPISLHTNPQPTTETEEEAHVATRVTMASNQINMYSQCATKEEEEESHIAEEHRQNSIDAESTDTSDAPSSTAILPQVNEVGLSDVYFQGSTKIMRTEEVSSQSLVKTNGTYESSQASVETNRNGVSPQGSNEVTEMQSTSIDESINPKIVLSQMGSSEIIIQAKQKLFSFLPKQEGDQTHDKEKQGTLKKTPISVKKMISAFESSRVQDKRLDLRPTKIKSSSSKFTEDAPSKDQELKEEKAEFTKAKSTGTLDQSKSTQTIVISKVLSTEQNCFNGANSSLKNEGLRILHSEVANKDYTDLFHILRETASQQDKPQPNDYEPPKVISSSSEAVLGVSSNDGESCELSPEQNHCANSSSSDGALGKVHSKVVKREHKEVPVLVRVSNCEATSSSQIYKKLLPTSCSDSGESGVSTDVVGNTQEFFMKDSLITDIERDLNDTLESLGCHEDKQDLHKSSSTWIFPNEEREVCRTTGGRAESALTYQARTSFSANRHLKESLHDDNIFCTPRDPDLDNSAKIADFRGSFGQALKIAVVVGLGILVLSGQRTKR